RRCAGREVHYPRPDASSEGERSVSKHRRTPKSRDLLTIPKRSPTPAECSKCTHRSSGRICTGLRELVLGGEQLTIGVENIRQRDDASLVGLLRGISRACQCGDLGKQLLLVSF